MSFHTRYDDVFRTMLNDCSSLIIPLINEVFDEKFTGKEEIVFHPNEHFLNQQDGEETKRITDTSFTIMGETPKKYHWECQSTADSSMLVRFFEYDAQIALEQSEIVRNILTVTFPHSAVLFLRCDSTTPDEMIIRIVTPGGEVSYEIPVMKSQCYTLEDIMSKQLLFLIPFYIFTHEKKLEECDRDSEKLEALKAEYAVIRRFLERQTSEKYIDEFTKCTIVDMSKRVLDGIAEKYVNVREGVESVMGGRVLEYEAKTIKNEGINEGFFMAMASLVRDGMITLSEAAARVHLNEEEFTAKMKQYEQ